MYYIVDRFPKDYRMENEVLIQLWMANGFFQQKGRMELEDIGNGIFNDLLWRSLFQDVEIDSDGNVVACKMHDLVHDLACSITRDECFSVVTVGDKERAVGRGNNTRHLAVDCKRLFSPNFGLSMSQSFLRTFLHLGTYKHNHDVPPPLNFSNLICLRVLDLSRTRLETLPDSIGELKLLRYLDLSETRIDSLRDNDFCNLRNLQTLKLHGCGNLRKLPGNMRKLTNLRQSDLKLERMPGGMGQLKCLHRLSNFIVSEDRGCGIEELEELDHLGGYLKIAYLGKVRDLRNAENAKLISKQNIHSLLMDWLSGSTSYPQTVSTHTKSVADALQPPPNIKRLYFKHYYNAGSDFPSWMNSTCLLNLVEIKLEHCPKCKHLPTLGLLPRLKFLTIHNIPVECIGNEFYSGKEGSNMIKTQGLIFFPSLVQLEFLNMRSLEEWKGWSTSPSPSTSKMKEGEVQVSVFPVLNRLSIHNCRKLRTFPSLTLPIKRLELSWCNEKIFEQAGVSLPYLSELSIEKFPGWARDQDMVLLQNLTALQRLKIVGCPMLINLPEEMQSLTSLKYLTIEKCSSLKSLNNCLQRLTTLHSMRIGGCPKLELSPNDFQPLISLKVLGLEGIHKMEAVPVVGSALTTITISSCNGLTNLSEWITKQRSLHKLELEYCENLRSLPDGLQQLTALERLQIKRCHSDLHTRCQENTGLDWHKIAHIPDVTIRR